MSNMIKLINKIKYYIYVLPFVLIVSSDINLINMLFPLEMNLLLSSLVWNIA